MKLADQYAQRNQNGVYAGNLLEAFYAINCLDNPDSADPADYEQRAKDNARRAPTWGPFLAWGSLPCGHWPVKAEGRAAPQKITAEGSGPIVVVGTTRDPATPYEWSVRLRDQLVERPPAHVRRGRPHGLHARSSKCVDGAINDYYIERQGADRRLTADPVPTCRLRAPGGPGSEIAGVIRILIVRAFGHLPP